MTPRERDISIYGVSIERDGRRVDPRDFYIKPPWWKRLWWRITSFLSGSKE